MEAGRQAGRQAGSSLCLHRLWVKKESLDLH